MKKNKTTNNISSILLGATFFFLSSCAYVPASSSLLSTEPTIEKTTKSQTDLKKLAAPSAKIPVAVYGFEDKTGQFKPTEAGQTLSRAVSQGADAILIKALQDAGSRSWFTVIERSNLNHLLKERQIITEMRQRYLGESKINPEALPPLLFAGVLFEGGIVGFDTNTVSGGAAARYLGIGGQTDYRQNVVSVYLRAVSVKTGEVLTTVTAEKTISSVGISANAFRFVSFDEILEADTGITSNEPGSLALRQAIEKAVYGIIMEGVEVGLWDFKDKVAGTATMNKYLAERDGLKLPTSPEIGLAQNQQKVPMIQKTPTNVSANARAPQNAILLKRPEQQQKVTAPHATKPVHKKNEVKAPNAAPTTPVEATQPVKNPEVQSKINILDAVALDRVALDPVAKAHADLKVQQDLAAKNAETQNSIQIASVEEYETTYPDDYEDGK